MKISIRYFAVLRDQRGLSQETLDVDVSNVGELYALEQSTHGFSLNSDQIRFAVNGQYVEANQAIQPGDEVVFIPPVAGG
ncbi:MoaD/ThiS family protein [soil metagenome]